LLLEVYNKSPIKNLKTKNVAHNVSTKIQPISTYNTESVTVGIVLSGWYNTVFVPWLAQLITESMSRHRNLLISWNG